MSVIDMFDRGWRMGGHRIAYVSERGTWTYDEAGELSCRIAHALLDTDLPAQAKIGVIAPNDPLAWIAVLGTWRAGMVWVPLNPSSSQDVLADLIDSFDCTVLFVHSTMISIVSRIRALGKVRLVVCIDAPLGDEPSLIDWCSEKPKTAPPIHVRPDDVVSISATGGTTGRPKGVVNTHRSFGVTFAHFMLGLTYDADEPVVNLAAAPLTHSAGMLSLPVSARGGTVVVIERAEPRAVLSAIERFSVTEVFLPPTVIYRLLEVVEEKHYRLESLRYLIYGAAPMSEEKLRRAIEVFGPILIEFYGQTEAFGAISFLRPEEHLVDGRLRTDGILASCGRPGPLVNVEIRDDKGNPLPVGRSGEVCVAGDLVMEGYYREPAKTAETVVEGWLHTGDIGHLDNAGYLYITDRKKDMIITGGLNVYPSEVEQVLWSDPAIQDCAVVGVPHEDWGEQVVAVVELNEGAALDRQALIRRCKDKLGSYKAPKRIDVVDRLPRSSNGKVLKKDVRESYWSDSAQRI
ncbi:long-chain fatty acid--CoA ligase [Rhodococcus sp. ABRD24]|uniref:class I adenylate-forming enzyme family protein n=1 Tax=Rhodococcus sp. ABRD24 TaxID=2507582 RepID=UPI00103D6C81|nr:AMP-binding protein [Rhodococcus sp. ABRD24]QBJ96382.1 long-chain fatty acid--CoA ligase [Rhodococcus sp. ABRD24]